FPSEGYDLHFLAGPLSRPAFFFWGKDIALRLPSRNCAKKRRLAGQAKAMRIAPKRSEIRSDPSSVGIRPAR
ncbi:hypothetical protein, partial [Mesorhizobium sp. M2D.F.Ca.ET.147.01.1.1]|uniref:hypothetical protein n=1 Tax=Mesorhizobium sp. M2D.F.Ca.ET.147.01.1.1 TaxID=2563934 RepID=UPI001AEE66CD